MRALGAVLGPSVLLVAMCAFGCEELGQALGGGDAGAATDAGTPATSADAGAVIGGGCGAEANTGIQLCSATSQCPSVVVDTQSMPGCGFRIRGAVVDLVCVCGTAICPVGVFATCTEATSLLATQTQQGVCVQLGEGRCLETSASSTTTSSSSSSSGSNPACDQQCMKDCGGGQACASVCNCD